MRTPAACATLTHVGDELRWLELARARYHLEDLQLRVAAYVESNPYTVSKRLEAENSRREKWVHRLEVTQPDPVLSLIVGVH